ncbi:MAG: peptidylprolyl isomerase [Planctomycetota bacterium]|nr:peptidylprolyl isomerase [Planctomycetota bacterium]
MLVAALILPLFVQDVQVSYTSPSMYIEGEPFQVTLSATVADAAAAAIPAWYLAPAAFGLDGSALGARPEGAFLSLVPGQTLNTSFDLAPAIRGSEAFKGRGFKLSFAGSSEEPVEVIALSAAPRGMDFMTLPEEQLGDYQVVMQTLAGPLWFEFWPDIAPNHTRNFLDLAYTGFYDDSHFHRVIPGFMIQGGGARPGKAAPRHVKNEFNERRHTPGVLSAARLPVDTRDEQGNVIPAQDSATSEFFVMHAVSPSLDGKYTGFGKLVEGIEVVNKLVFTGNPAFDRRDARSHAPVERQTIYKAIVVKAPKR